MKIANITYHTDVFPQAADQYTMFPKACLAREILDELEKRGVDQWIYWVKWTNGNTLNISLSSGARLDVELTF